MTSAAKNLILITMVVVASVSANHEMGRIADARRDPDSYSGTWGYDRTGRDGKHTPDQWPLDDPACSVAGVQSPIDVQTTAAVYNKDYKPFKWTFPNGVSSFSSLLLDNYGWTENMDVPAGIRVTGGPFPSTETYELANIHMHRISEHTIDGGHSPVEFHLVTLNIAVCPWYLNAAAGECDSYPLPQSSDRALAIFSLHFKEGPTSAPNAFIDPISTAMYADFDAMKLEGGETIVTDLDIGFLNSMQTYYSYRGTITIVPCVASVTWTVFAEVLPATGKQLQAFLNVFPAENYRPIQALGSRVVYTNIQPQDVHHDSPTFESDNGNSDTKISAGGAGGIAAGSFVLGCIVVGAVVWLKNRSYRSIHSDHGSNGKNSFNGDIQGTPVNYQQA